MDRKISSIQHSFDKEIRIFERYLNDIHKSIGKLNKQAKDLEKYIDSGGSLDIPSRPVKNSTAMTMGMVDSPEMREVASFALNNRMEELKSYIEISLTMAFSHFMTIFDSRYMDLISLYYERNPKLLQDITLERKLMNFSYKPFKTQILSIQNNMKIDFYKLLGLKRVADLIEIRATRNLIIHNSSIVNNLYLDIVEGSSFKEGEKRPMTIAYFEQSTELMQLFFSILSQEINDKLWNQKKKS